MSSPTTHDPRVVVIDFETYFDTKAKYDSKHLGYYEYIHDSRFRVFGMSVDDGTEARWVPAEKVHDTLDEYRGDILVAHNTFFDAAILAWKYSFQPAYILDTLQLANHVLGTAKENGSNSLRSLAERLGLEPKGRLEFMDGVKDPDEAQLAMLATYAVNDARLERQVWDKLIEQVSRRDFELWLLDHTIKLYTSRPLQIDAAKVMLAIGTVEEYRDKLVADSGVSKELLNSNPQFAAELATRLRAAKLPVPMKAPAKPRKDGVKRIPALSKSDAAFQRLADSPIPEIATLVQARLVQRSATTTLARLYSLKRMAETTGWLPVHLVYYGAGTGRFAGGGGWNVQNMTSEGKAATDFDRLVARLVRECIVAGDGMVFTPTDAAQIEARVLPWLAGEDQIVDAFGNGADLYSEFISEVLDEDIHKPTAEDKKDPAKVQHMTIMRSVGKESILGLGYNMGAEKFSANMRNGGTAKNKQLSQWVESGGLGPLVKLPNSTGKAYKMAIKIVEAYRGKYPKIVRFWKDMEIAFKRATRGVEVKVGKLWLYKVAPRVVGIELPSKRTLYYRDLRWVTTRTKYGKEKLQLQHGKGQNIYGGLLAENVTQAVARDILAEAIYKTEQAGYPVVLHIHDDITPRVPEEKGQEALDFLINALSTPPEWGKGLKLGAEGSITRSLAK